MERLADDSGNELEESAEQNAETAQEEPEHTEQSENSVLDNTTDTGETSLGGKQNDTTTLRDTVSKSKVTKKNQSAQEKNEKSSPAGKIDDVGEKILGARKDMLHSIAKAFDDATLKSLIELPFIKAFKKPNLKKAVESGALREEDALFYEAMFAALVNTNKPSAQKRGGRSKVENNPLASTGIYIVNGKKVLTHK